MNAPVIFLADTDRPSYVEVAGLYERAFAAFGVAVQSRPLAARDRIPADAWVLHHTIGPMFSPCPGLHNTAVVFHEWDRYPAAWIAALNTFESVWAPSTYVGSTLQTSGLRVPMRLVRPPVTACRVPQNASWHASSPFRFLAIGDAHFRKGFHLLFDGFVRAFPVQGEATLTVKLPRGCGWRSPRPDITIVADSLGRDELLALYSTHDAYVSASLGEGLGLPVAEAVMAALPVVVNVWGGHADLVRPADCWPISHEVVPQAFCSDPAYYAPGQRCAYASPERIAFALRTVFEATAHEREARARRAKAAIEETHGMSRIVALVQGQYEALAAASTCTASSARSR
jgi:hypothetical protein